MEVLKTHFSNLGDPKETHKPYYNQDKLDNDRKLLGDRREGSRQQDPIDQLDDKMTADGIREAIKDLNNGKAAGYDEIIAELIKAGGEFKIAAIRLMCDAIMDNESMPE